MNNRDYKKYLLPIILGIEVVAIFLFVFLKYPRVSITNIEEFYGGPEHYNLKDFTYANGVITSTSGDAWINYYYSGKENILGISIDVEYCDQIDNWVEVYVFSGDEHKVCTPFILKEGVNNVSFTEPLYEGKDIELIRFDLASLENYKLILRGITINSRRVVMLDWLRLFTIFGSFTVFLYAAYKKSMRLKEGKEKIVNLTSIAIICALIGYLFLENVLLEWDSYRILFFVGIMMLCVSYICFDKLGVPLMALTGAVISFAQIELLNSGGLIFVGPLVWLRNILVVLAVYLVFCIASPKFKYFGLIPHFLALILGLVNHYFYIFRGRGFELVDILDAGTAFNVLGQYKFPIDRAVIICLLMTLTYVLIFVLSKPSSKQKLIIQCLIPLVGIAGLVYCWFNPVEVDFWNKLDTYRSKGYVVTFISDAKKQFTKPTPTNYSAKYVEEMLGKYNEEAQESVGAQNIIVIMNESLTDLPEIYGFKTNEDCMPFIHGLEGNNVKKGHALVSVLGGGTSNTEYEFLTGNSFAFLAGNSNPYVQYVNKDTQSIARVLGNRGYDTIAFHPFWAAGYNRINVYNHFDFDDFISLDDELVSTETYGGEYVTDKADFEEIKHLVKTKKSSNLFIFNVTMQNHGSYMIRDDLEKDIYPVEESLRWNEMIEYLSLTKRSDEAFEELVNHFSAINERTIILMFGDHQPKFASGPLYDEIYKVADTDKAMGDENQRQYLVPYVIWANYELSDKDYGLTSVNYLRSILLYEAGVYGSNYDRFVYDVQNEYPSIYFGGYLHDDQFHSLAGIDNEALLSDYQKAAYYTLFEEEYVDDDIWK